MIWIIDKLYPMTNYMSQGGAIMVPLVLVSIIMWTLIIKKSLFLRQMRIKNMPRSMAAQLVKNNKLPDPKKYKGATAVLVAEFLRRRAIKPGVDRFVIDETVLAMGAGFDRHLAAIGVLAAIAPLLGLLGTVLGMITTFDIISVHGTGNAQAMAGGISKALITTQTGLLIAIPGLTMKNFLSSRAQSLKHKTASMGIYLQRIF